MAKLGPLQFDRQKLLQRSGPMRTLNYAYELVRLHRVLQVPFRKFGGALNRYGEWSRSVRSGRTQVELGLPWMVYDSLDFLKDFLGPGDLAFEYSSGGSTIFFAKLGLRGFSVEHDATWGERVESELRRSVPNADWAIRIIPPNPASSDPRRQFRSSSPTYRDFAFVDYVNEVRSFPEDYFKLVAVDGRARNSCIRTASAHVAPGGVLLIDNSDRQEYWAEIDRLKASGWQSKEFNGPLPASTAFGRTTVLYRPSHSESATEGADPS